MSAMVMAATLTDGEFRMWGNGSAATRCRVLVVEDEYFIADDLARALARHGAEVLGPMPRLREALDCVEGPNPPDMAVLDISLNGETSYPVAAALRRCGIHFVFVTGYDRDSLPAEFQDVSCWEKPVEPDELVRALLDVTAV